MEYSFVQTCLTHCLYPDHPLPVSPPDLDWDRVYDLLCRHGLAGLFYALGRACPGLWPPELRQQLREYRYHALLHGDRCTEQVAAILTTLRQDGIPVIVLKGWALIPTVYGGDYGQRTYADIDLLVSPRDAARAERIMRDCGYRTMPEPWSGFERRYGNCRAYQLPREPAPFSRAFAIGLHWRLLDTPFYFRRMSVERLFVRAEPLRVAGVDVYSLATEDNLVYSCGHLALHHQYDEALFRYYEMAFSILQAGEAFDWDVVAARTLAWQLVLPVQGVLAHLVALWPGIVPVQASEAISSLRPTLAERHLHYWVVEQTNNHTVRSALTWLTMPGLGQRWRFLLEVAFPSPIYMRQRYGPAPGGLWPLLYLRRVATAVKYLSQRKSSPG